MRLWTLHPCYLDSKGLVALWREGLLAQHVLLGKTTGYKNHPQLWRFKQQPNPTTAIGDYLWLVCDEADKRQYRFTREKIIHRSNNHIKKIPATNGQIKYEWQHLLKKLQQRDRKTLTAIEKTTSIKPHPLFDIIEGGIADWEKI